MEGQNESECLVPIRVPNGGHLLVPTYFRFRPKDHELISNFLLPKSLSLPLAVDVIAEVDVYKFNPWELPTMSLYGEKDWYFFTLRSPKYPSRARPNRFAGTGFWKLTGHKKKIGHSKVRGIKKSLTFFNGRGPNATRTEWLMEEYSLLDVDSSSTANGRKHSMVNEWVIVRVYKSKDTKEKSHPTLTNEQETSVDGTVDFGIMTTPNLTLVSPDLGLDGSLIGFGSPIELMVDEIVPNNLVNDQLLVKSPEVTKNIEELLPLPLEHGLVGSEMVNGKKLDEIVPNNFDYELLNSFPLMPEDFDQVCMSIHSV